MPAKNSIDSFDRRQSNPRGRGKQYPSRPLQSNGVHTSAPANITNFICRLLHHSGEKSRPATRRKIQNGPIFSAADRHSSCADFHEFVASRNEGRILTCKYIRIAHIASHLSVSTQETLLPHSPSPTTPQTLDARQLGMTKQQGTNTSVAVRT